MDKTRTALATLTLFASEQDAIWLQWVQDGYPQPEPPQIRVCHPDRREQRLLLAMARAQDEMDKHLNQAVLGNALQGFWDGREAQREKLYG